MRSRWLIPVGALLCLCLAAHGDEPAVASKRSAGYLVMPREPGQAATPFTLTNREKGDKGANTRSELLPYEPQPGDIILYDSFSKFQHFIYRFARTSAPMHASMVIAREDGT